MAQGNMTSGDMGNEGPVLMALFASLSRSSQAYVARVARNLAKDEMESAVGAPEQAPRVKLRLVAGGCAQ